MRTIGIPKALLYHEYFPTWKIFWEDLNYKLVVSNDTSKAIFSKGIEAGIEEACLPLKIYLGHVYDLMQKKVDYLFVPRYVSVEKKRYLCPKIMGLPDITRNIFPSAPPFVEQKSNYLKKQAGVNFVNAPSIKKSNNYLISKYKKAEAKAKARELKYQLRKYLPNNNKRKDITIGLLGRSYIINDDYLSMNLREKIRNYGVNSLTSKSLSPEEIAHASSVLPKDIFWSMGSEIVGSGISMLHNKQIDGAILVISFGCGPDSLLADIVRRYYKKEGVPLLSLTLDEHGGEAGLITRMEAFLDMLIWRKKKLENNIPTHGNLVDTIKNFAYPTGEPGCCSTSHYTKDYRDW